MTHSEGSLHLRPCFPIWVINRLVKSCPI
jgi:hypothetical protein